jgi:hypothetical protein
MSTLTTTERERGSGAFTLDGKGGGFITGGGFIR